MTTTTREPIGDTQLMRIATADSRPWYRKPRLRGLYLLMVPAALGVEWTSGYDSSMMNSLQAVPAWTADFDHPDSARLGLLSAMYSLGALMAIPIVPPVSRYLGRRRSIQVASLVLCLGASLQAGAHGTSMFLAARWLLGFGIPLAIVNAAALLGELSYARERAVVTSLFNACWFVGAIVAAGVTYGTFHMGGGNESSSPDKGTEDKEHYNTWAWRIPSLLQLVPSLCQLSALPWCPESPRWLVSHDRHDEALAILQKFHGEGDDGAAFVQLEFAEIRATIDQEQRQQQQEQQVQQINQNNQNNQTRRGRKQCMSWLSAYLDWDVLRDPPMRRRFLIAVCVGVFSQWSGNGLLSFYMKKILSLIGIHNDRTVQQIILANTCWGFITSVPAAIFAPRFGRRPMFLLCTIGTCIVFSVWTVASARFAIDGTPAAAIPVLVFIFVYSPFYNIGWNALAYTYMVEVFPFHQRAQGIAVEQLALRCAVFFNTYVNPIALDAIFWKYYIIYCVWILIEVLVVWAIFPETANRTLEELSFMFEGEAVQKNVQSNVDKAMREVHLETLSPRRTHA